jgi:hypothetical protein
LRDFVSKKVQISCHSSSPNSPGRTYTLEDIIIHFFPDTQTAIIKISDKSSPWKEFFASVITSNQLT